MGWGPNRTLENGGKKGRTYMQSNFIVLHHCNTIRTHRLQSTTTTATLLTARVGWDWGHVFDSADSDACTCEGTEGRLCAWAWSLGSVTAGSPDLDVDSGDADFFHSLSDVLGSKHGCVWGCFVTVSLDLHAASDTNDRFP